MRRLVLACVLSSAACTVEDIAAVQRADASVCGDNGPVVRVGDVPCTSGRSQQFRAALCSCEDSTVSAPLTTTLIQTGAAPWGAAVAWNGRLDVSAQVTVAGAFINGSSDSIVGNAPGSLSIAGDLQHAGSIEGMLDLDIGGDVQINGSLHAQNVSIAGTLSTPASASIAITGTDAAPRRDHQPFTTTPPCACDPNSQHDIASLVSDARVDNDNATIALDPNVLANVQTHTTLTLPCGRYHLDRISGAADVTLAVNGHVALYVEGDVALERALTITVQDGALDLFVAGNLTVLDTVRVGDEEMRVRTHLGGSGTLNLGSTAIFGGLIYAPRAELVARGTVETWGPVFVRRLSSEVATTIHYDAADWVPDAAVCD